MSKHINKIRVKIRNLLLNTPGIWKIIIDNYIAKTNGLDIEVWGQYNLKSSINFEIAKIYPKISKKDRKNLVRRMARANLLYGFRPDEFIGNGLNDDCRGRDNEFISDKHRDIVCMATMGGDLSKYNELTDKYGIYKKLEKYFKRECIMLDSANQESLQRFRDFCGRHNKFIVKPLKGSLGKSTYILSTKDIPGFKEKLAEIVDGGPVILEELIMQTDDMKQWNPDSVNTVRLPLIEHDGEYTVFLPFMRTGRVGSCVDNAGAGGIFASIDPETGIIITDGVNESNRRYDKHPDSGLTFKGFQIPDWEGLVKLAKEIHSEMEGHKYIGWDFAHTDNGWVLIEGNWGQTIGQMALRKGFKKEFFDLMGYKA